MATLTATPFVPAVASSRPGALRRALDRLVAARQAQVDRAIAARLLTFDPQTLAEHGFGPDDVSRPRTASAARA